ncbi:hypothetical protein FAZ69_09565 [Trinickia terrae]|uniref:SMI1/KNR4 family protein n=1 Tax=Trinickia terrae TaxID=2571161 RepID=A0A4U1I7B0_9BURK|nr:hypothetical protein [Trinickia terrae]TKC89207.1 hypothetical protein FAZ69_09565 [Trinickia terrae]
MRDVDSIFDEIRQMLGVCSSSTGSVIATVAAGLPANQEISKWLAALKGCDLLIPWSAEELRLHGSKESLNDGQIGYRLDRAGRRLPDWPDEWLVLGAISGDPIIGEVSENGCAILFARHGAGKWQAKVASSSMEPFATVLLTWCDLFVQQYSKDIYDDTFAIRPDFLAELRQRIDQTLPVAEADVFMSMVDG